MQKDNINLLLFAVIIHICILSKYKNILSLYPRVYGKPAGEAEYFPVNNHITKPYNSDKMQTKYDLANLRNLYKTEEVINALP